MLISQINTLELSGDVNLKVTSVASRYLRSARGVLIESPSEERYYASPYLPDAISDKSNANINTNWPARMSVRSVYHISGLSQLIQVTLAIVTVQKGKLGGRLKILTKIETHLEH